MKKLRSQEERDSICMVTEEEVNPEDPMFSSVLEVAANDSQYQKAVRVSKDIAKE
jgi:hypothetical protein